MRRGVRAWARDLVCLFLSFVFLGMGLTSAGWAKMSPADYRNVPWSGGLLNRLAPMKGPTQKAIFATGPFQRIYPAELNKPSADTTALDTQSETSVVTVGATNVAVGFNDSGSLLNGLTHFTGYSQSPNSGLSFADRGTLPNSTEGDAGDPVLAADNTSGAVYMSTLGITTGNNIQIFKSTDGGQTFGAPVNGTPGFTGDSQDKPWITVDNATGTGRGNVYLCWTRFVDDTNNGEVRFTRSTNAGATFGPSTGVLLSTGGQGCNVVTGPDHSVYVFYYRGTGAGGEGGDNKLFMRKSTNLGVSFGSEVQVADLATTTVTGDLALNGGLRSNTFPQAAVNPANGHVVVVYNDDPNTGSSADNGDIFSVLSTNGGTSWSAPTRVNDDTARDQFFPSVAFTANGSRIMFSYYSRSQDPSNFAFHRRGRLGFVNTSTGAIGFARSFQLSPNTPVVIGQDPAVNATYMGDYDQNVAQGNSAFLFSWSDNRAGNAFHANQPDTRFARTSTATTITDASVNVSASPSTINLGQNTVFTVNVSAGSANAEDAFLNVPSVPGLAIQSATANSGRCDLVNQFVGCSLGTIAAGQTKSVQIVATGSGVAATRTLTAGITTSSFDTNGANDNASTNVTVGNGSAVVQVFSTGNIAVPIPDLGTVEVPLDITAEGTAVRVFPFVRLNHTFDSDLVLSLVAPSGRVVQLSNRNGGNGDNYGSGPNDCTGTKTLFDDFQPTLITAGTVPSQAASSPNSRSDRSSAS